MNRIFNAVLAGAALVSAAAAEEKRVDDAARQYVDAFLAGDMQKLLDHAEPPLRKLMKDADTMKSIRASTIGDHAAMSDEQLSIVYTRLVKSAAGQTFSVTATVTGDGQLSGFLIQPASEAPSKFLDYKTKADLRLPFNGNWTVFWGGRTLKENYHAVSEGQRFADDILMMKDGVSHSGDGGKNDDYYCFGQPIVSPAVGLVASVVDGVADNVPGKMNPEQTCGNHIVLDLGNQEYLFMAHFQNGTIKVKAGDRVTQGQILGRCGNSGNSSEPHLHIHLQNTPIFGSGKGMPLQFQHYQADGKLVERGEPTKGQVICHAAAENTPQQ